MPEPLNILDTHSYMESCLLLSFLLFISFHLYRRFSVGPIRNDSIISVSAIQYRCIYTNIYYICPPFFLLFFSCNLKYSNGRFFLFFFLLFFRLKTEEFFIMILIAFIWITPLSFSFSSSLFNFFFIALKQTL